MHQKFTHLFAFALLPFLGLAQTCITPSPIVFTLQDSKDEVATKINANHSTYKMRDLDEFKAQLDKCKNEVDRQIAEKNKAFNETTRHLRNIIQLQDVDAVRKRIAAQTDSKQQAQQRIDEQLKNVTYKGLYLVALRNIDPLNSPKFPAMVTAAVMPKAITDLNGAFIQSLTKITNNTVEYDRVSQRISGDMRVGQTYYNNTAGAENLHFRLLEVEVNSYNTTKNSAENLGVADTKNVEILRLDLGNADISGFLSKLTNDKEIINNTFAKVQEVVKLRQTVVADQNKNAASTQENIHNENKKNTEDYDTSIDKEKKTLTEYAQKITKISEQNEFGLVATEKNLETTMADVKQRLLARLERINKEKTIEKQKELLYSEGKTTPNDNPDPVAVLRSQAMDAARGLEQSNGTISKFLQDITMENNSIATFSESKTKDVYRKLNRAWFYYTPGNESDFKYIVVAEFVLNDDKTTVNEVVAKPVEKPKTEAEKAVENPKADNDLDVLAQKRCNCMQSSTTMYKQILKADNPSKTYYQQKQQVGIIMKEEMECVTKIPNYTEGNGWKIIEIMTEKCSDVVNTQKSFGSFLFNRQPTEEETQADSTAMAEAAIAAAAQMAQLTTFSTKKLGNFTLVEGGTFVMGNENATKPNEKPEHEVTLSSFYIGQTEVTRQQWANIMGETLTTSCPECPITSKTWYEVQNFIKKLNLVSVERYRLPTEAEWEYASTGGSLNNQMELTDSMMHAYSWYDNTVTKPQPISMKTPNELGLFDMIGNVAEWCSDWYDLTYYTTSPNLNPKGGDGIVTKQANGEAVAKRVVRGGAFSSTSEDANFTRRSRYDPEKASGTLGFRLVMER
jgi:formylglycine-generating enzyme required for sulfatase activity